MVRTKVFVGNLDFQTKESELVAQFGQAGKVISANIITRGPRSLGYGFVEMESEEDANKAVALMHKKEVDGRPINVEVAKPRDETATSAEPRSPSNTGRGGFRGRGRGGRGAPRGGESAQRGGPRAPRGAPRGGRPAFRPRAEGQQQQQQQPKPANANANASPSQQPKAPKKTEEERPPSKTTLFVANLPFKMDDEQFAKVFKDAGLAYKSAHVVKNQRSGRSKGFGFVEFENEQDQQKALTTVNKKVVDERELVVKVALAEQQKPAEATTEKK